MYGSSGNIEESIKYFNKAVLMNTYQNREIRQKAADIIIGHGKTREDFQFAINLIKDNIKYHQLDAQNYLYLMILLNRSGSLNPNNFAEVIRIGKEALLLSPTRAQIYFEMGQAEFNMRNVDAGIEYFKKAVELNPATMESQWNLLTAYSLARQNDKADQVRNNMQKLGYDFKDLIQLKRLYNI